MAASDNTALISLIGAILMTLLGGAMTFMKYNELQATDADGPLYGMQEGTADPPGLVEQLRIKQKKVYKLAEEIAQRKLELSELQEKYRQSHRLYKVAQVDLNRNTLARDFYKDKKEAMVEWREKVERVRDKVQTVKDQVLRDRQTFKSKKDAEYQVVRQKFQDWIDEFHKQILAEKNRLTRRRKDIRDDRSRLLTALGQQKEELEKITQRKRLRTDVDPDGIVVQSDLELKLAIINLGLSAGVRKGFRFEVFQMKGNRRVHKGFIEVKDVDDETASCTIVEREIRLPRDPVTSYVAHQPEELFSPYVSGGETGTSVQRLSSRAKEMTQGMNQDDPIVPGDRIWNPFYDRKKSLHFAIEGEPIKYNRSYIVNLVRAYGGTIDTKVSAKTDFLVAGKWTTDEVKKARELGVKIFREFDLFRFLAK